MTDVHPCLIINDLVFCLVIIKIGYLLSSEVSSLGSRFGITLVITVLSYWYNNDWTSAAKLGSKVIDALKDGKVTKEEVNNLLEECNKDIYSEEKKVDD